MQTPPAGWPAESPIEVLPELFLDLAGASWPPARDGAPTGTVTVGEWSVDRKLTGSSLPGQARGAAGFSIATGSVTFPQPDGAPLSPWGRGSLGIGPGGACTLYASHAGPVVSAGLTLGQFRVAPISGSNTSGTVSLELEESSIRLKKPFTLKWRYNMKGATNSDPKPELDACWVLDQIARAGGYYQTPKPVASTIVSLPLVGGTMAETGATVTAQIDGWAAAGSAPGLGPASTVSATISAPAMPDSMFITADVYDGGGRVLIGSAVFDFGNTGVTVATDTGTILGVAPYEASTGVRRVQAQITRQSSTVFSVRARSQQGPWSNQILVTFPAAPWTSANTWVTVDTAVPEQGRWIRGVQAHTADDVGVWATPTAEIDLSYSPLHAAFGVEDATAWDTAQEIATKTMGALWISEAGVFTYRNGNRMRGTSTPVETVEALDSLASLDWTVDPAEIADRVELTYTPTNVIASKAATTLWEATDSVRVAAHASVTLNVDIEGTTNDIASFIPVWDTSIDDARMSRWAASTSPAGNGERPSDDAVSITARLVSMSRIRIQITNNTDAPLWLVDGNGEPCLILRCSLHIAPSEPATIASGVAEDDAASPLSVDAGAWVQNLDAAQRMLDWLTGQTQTAKPTLNQVAVKPNLARQIGDVIRLTDGHTGLRAHAIITGITLDGGPDGYTQNLDVTLLDVVFSDFDNWLEANSIVTFADFDAWLAANTITDFAQFDDWAIDLGGTW